jgi:PAS domain S-box-containing protein
LDYRVAVLLLEDNNKEPELSAIKGLSQDFISAWNTEEDLVRYLWREIDSPTIVKCDNLEAKISNSAKRLGLKDMFLTVPLRQFIDYKEKRIGLAIAALAPKNYELNIDIMTLDIIASLITGAITTCKMRTDTIEINKKLELDITERKRVEETLRESEERYRLLFTGALDGIALADAETGVMLDCNQALADLVGRNRAELIGQHQAILHPPLSNNAGFSLTFKQHQNNKEGQVLETQVLSKTGEIREVEIKANLLYLQGRKILQGIFRDITDRKKADQEIKKKIKELEDFYDMAVGRELRMKELKEQMKELKEALEKYKKL